MSSYSCLHLRSRSNDCACAFSELHVLGCMRVLINIFPCSVPYACKSATRVHHGLSCYVFWVMEFHRHEPETLAFGGFNGWFCLQVVEVIYFG